MESLFCFQTRRFPCQSSSSNPGTTPKLSNESSAPGMLAGGVSRWDACVANDGLPIPINSTLDEKADDCQTTIQTERSATDYSVSECGGLPAGPSLPAQFPGSNIGSGSAACSQLHGDITTENDMHITETCPKIRSKITSGSSRTSISSCGSTWRKLKSVSLKSTISSASSLLSS